MATSQKSPIVKLAIWGIVLISGWMAFSSSSKYLGSISDLPVEGANDISVKPPSTKSEKNKPLFYKSEVIANKGITTTNNDSGFIEDSVFYSEASSKNSANSPFDTNLKAGPSIDLPSVEVPAIDYAKVYSFKEMIEKMALDAVSANGAIINGQYVNTGDEITSAFYYNAKSKQKNKMEYPILLSVDTIQNSATIASVNKSNKFKIVLDN